MLNPTEPTRAYIYRVLLAAASVAYFYGLVTAEEIDAWAALADAVLYLGAPGLAVRNTSTKRCDGCLDAPHGSNPERWDA